MNRWLGRWLDRGARRDLSPAGGHAGKTGPRRPLRPLRPPSLEPSGPLDLTFGNWGNRRTNSKLEDSQRTVPLKITVETDTGLQEKQREQFARQRK